MKIKEVLDKYKLYIYLVLWLIPILLYVLSYYEDGVMVGLNDTVSPSTVRAFFYSQPFYVLLVILVFTEFSETPPALMVICGATFIYIAVAVSTFAFSSLWIVFHGLFIYAFN